MAEHASHRRPTLTAIEPVLPVVLGLHGLAICLVGGVPRWPAGVFAVVVLLGLAGLVGWSSERARVVRAVACTGSALGLSIAEPVLVSSLLQWYYCVAAVYSLMLVGRAAPFIGLLTGACYVTQVAAGAVPVPYRVAVLRAGVLTALGLATWTAGVAYRASAAQAEVGRREAERVGLVLEHAATHDDLTGLPNRSLLHSRLDAELVPGGVAALLLLDLDRFKEVNDTLGHRYGDVLLQQVGDRLAQVLGDGDTICRLGGDEFAVLVPHADRHAAVAIAQRLSTALQDPFQVEEALVAIDGSIGIALYPDHAADGDRLLQRSDVAMYSAKAAGEGAAVYDEGSDRHSAERLVLLAELRGSLARREMVVEYQPVIDTDTRAPVGLEALVRWDHPARGRLAPDVFIPLAERSGFIKPLTTFVLETALAQCARWAEAGADLHVSVNLSARNLQQPELPQQVRDALAAHGLPAERLTLEVTESSLMTDPVRARALLTELYELGVGVAIDDFGTGMASLSYLKNLPVTELKIDKSFISNMVGDVTDSLIVRGVVDLANGMGLNTVAEGVEDAAALERLGSIGCRHAQGYAISRPMPADAVLPWLSAASARRD